MTTQNGVIKILDVQTANQIAAGEVVERPVSVVKELVENAIDAGAKRITVKTTIDETNSFINQIQVIDDGWGMIPEDILTAFYRHATSKLQTIEDLNTIYSLGFRGEALPSIASVSQVEITSREHTQIAATVVRVVDGKPQTLGEVGAPVGTKIVVADLFYNTPARKKFLKTASAEMGQIATMISRLILSRPDIAFIFQSDERTVLHSAGKGDLSQSVIAVYGAEVAADLSPVDFSGSNGQIKIKGFVSAPPFSRSSKKYYHFFVNGRLVQSKELANIVETAYETLLPKGKYPMVVLYLEIPASTIDVNVHPSKTEIRFRHLEEIRDTLLAAIKAGLLPKAGIMPNLDKVHSDFSPNNIDNKLSSDEDNSEATFDNRIVTFDLDSMDDDYSEAHLMKERPKNPPGANSPVFDFNIGGGKTEAEQANYASNLFNRLLRKNVASVDDNPKPVQQEIALEPEATKAANLFDSLKPLGQVNASYIVAVAGEHLYIVDQHAAHERILYEKFAKKFSQSKNQSSMLAVPVNIDLGSLQTELLLQNIDKVSDFGFVVEFFGDSTFIIRGVPVWYGEGQEAEGKHKAEIFKDNIGEFFINILDRIIPSEPRHNKPNQALSLSALTKEELFTMACKSAVKANQYLSQADIIWIFSQLSQAEKPQTCPHGRPTVIKISDDEIRKRFMRT